MISPWMKKMESIEEMAKLPSHETLVEMFQSADTNNSGAISVNELQGALRMKGMWKPFNKKVAAILLDLVDTNESGTINFEEFGTLWKYLVGWVNCFRSFDLNDSGDLDRRELRDALLRLGYCVSSQQVKTYLDEYDRSKTGNISFDDFIEVCIAASKHSFGETIHEKIADKMIY